MYVVLLYIQCTLLSKRTANYLHLASDSLHAPHHRVGLPACWRPVLPSAMHANNNLHIHGVVATVARRDWVVLDCRAYWAVGLWDCWTVGFVGFVGVLDC